MTDDSALSNSVHQQAASRQSAVGLALFFGWMQYVFYSQPLDGTSQASLPLPYWPLSTLFGMGFALICIAAMHFFNGRLFSRALAWSIAVCGAVGTFLLLAVDARGAIAIFVLSCAGCGMSLSGLIILWGGLISREDSQRIETIVPAAFFGGSLLALVLMELPRELVGFTAWVLPPASCLLARRLERDESPGMNCGSASKGEKGEFVRQFAGICVFLVAMWFAYSYLKFSTEWEGTAASKMSFFILCVVAILMVTGVLRFGAAIDDTRALLIALPLMAFAYGFASLGESFGAAARILGTLAYLFLYLFIWIVLTKLARSHDGNARLLFACLTFSTSLGTTLGYGLSLAWPAVPLSARGESPAFALVMSAFVTVSILAVRYPRHRLAPIGEGETLSGRLEESARTQAANLAKRYSLTAREEEVLAYVLLGDSRADIRDALGISINTVNTHIRRIYDKTGMHGRKELLEGVSS